MRALSIGCKKFSRQCVSIWTGLLCTAHEMLMRCMHCTAMHCVSMLLCNACITIWMPLWDTLTGSSGVWPGGLPPYFFLHLSSNRLGAWPTAMPAAMPLHSFSLTHAHAHIGSGRWWPGGFPPDTPSTPVQQPPKHVANSHACSDATALMFTYPCSCAHRVW